MDDAVQFGSHLRTPIIERDVPGPRGENGLLLKAPFSEALIWDLETEILGARRMWMPERDGWWVAAPYLKTLIAITLRTFPSVLVIGPDEDHLISRDGTDNRQERLL